jgi:hypothetical protein
VHTGELRPGCGQAAWPAAGGEQERVVGQREPVVQAHVPRARRDVGDAPAEVRGDLVLGVELRRPDEQPLALHSASQILLGQRRPLVGQPRFIPHQGELPREALAA